MVLLFGGSVGLFSDSTLPPFIRVIWWWRCLQAWAALRHDDQRRIRPRDLVVSAGSLRGELWRLRTTGRDKMVKSRPIIIPPMSYVHVSGWLLVGWHLHSGPLVIASQFSSSFTDLRSEVSCICAFVPSGCDYIVFIPYVSSSAA